MKIIFSVACVREGEGGGGGGEAETLGADLLMKGI